MTEILVQILLSASTVAVIFLIAVLWRSFNILGDVNKVTKIASARANQLDETIENIVRSLKGGAETIKGFVYSLGLAKKIKKVIDNNINQKGETDEGE